MFFTEVARGSPPRLCDRDKEHSTIIYESPQPNQPLLRLGWNKQDPRYMATLLLDCPKVVVLDIRRATPPALPYPILPAVVRRLIERPHRVSALCVFA